MGRLGDRNDSILIFFFFFFLFFFRSNLMELIDAYPSQCRVQVSCVNENCNLALLTFAHNPNLNLDRVDQA